jgi:hypothetical protein
MMKTAKENNLMGSTPDYIVPISSISVMDLFGAQQHSVVTSARFSSNNSVDDDDSK